MLVLGYVILLSSISLPFVASYPFLLLFSLLALI